MSAASRAYLQYVLRDLKLCCKHAGVPFPSGGVDVPALPDEISRVLDRNEKLCSVNGLRKTAGIFTHLYSVAANVETEPFDANSFRGLCRQWAGYTGNESLDELMNGAEEKLSSLAMPFESGDISVYEHSRVSAAIGSCIGNGPVDADSKSFLLYSLDLSGIQSFLYSIGNRGALKGLKTRSFYLGILMTHTADTVLEQCGYSRLNLIYCGGGKAHMLLENTEKNLSVADSLVSQANQFLQKHFGTSLYMASGYAEASLNELASGNGDTPCFSDLFRKASAMISQKKLRRYSAAELSAFNSREEDPDRECTVCGNSAHLTERDGEYLCEDCLRFENFAFLLKNAPSGFAVTNVPRNPCLGLPFEQYLCSQGSSQPAHRFYAVNPEHAGAGFPLYLGNYQPDSYDVTFEALGKASRGVKRLGIVRMDVDNLGRMFANGFVNPDAKKPYAMVSLVRYSSLSAAVTRFFQRDINKVIACDDPDCPLTKIAGRGRDISVVYSGGDDLFLAGAWDQVADAALAVQEAFSRYTRGKASISGGIGLYGVKEPIRVLAARCADLEDASKQVPGKAAVSVFDSCYSFTWKEYRETVLSQMLPAVEGLCSRESKGNTFLYHVMELLKSVSKDQIAIARLAYLFARHCPSGVAGEQFTAVANRIYGWALEPKMNTLLQCAILLYVYLHREENENE